MTKAPLHDIPLFKPSIVEKIDVVSFGSPVEGARPAKEDEAFVDRLSKVEEKSNSLLNLSILGRRCLEQLEEKTRLERLRTIASC